MKRHTMMLIGIAILLGTFTCMLTAMLINLAAGVNNSGSPELAAEWQAVLTPLTPTASELHKDPPDLEFVTFPNGEWIIGFAQNSHGISVRGGGTLVVKDSRGNVRAFFGHVCGPHYLRTFFCETPDLDGFYARLKRLEFTEHVLP
jgi:hypothetical protein